MISAILNSGMLDSDTAILDSDTLVSSLRFTQKHSLNLTLHSVSGLVPNICTKKPHSWHSDSTWMIVAILKSAILDSAILYKTLNQTSSIWLKLIHSESTWWWHQPSWTLAILDSDTAILHSETLVSSLRFTQKHSDLNSDPDWQTIIESLIIT